MGAQEAAWFALDLGLWARSGLYYDLPGTSAFCGQLPPLKIVENDISFILIISYDCIGIKTNFYYVWKHFFWPKSSSFFFWFEKKWSYFSGTLKVRGSQALLSAEPNREGGPRPDIWNRKRWKAPTEGWGLLQGALWEGPESQASPRRSTGLGFRSKVALLEAQLLQNRKHLAPLLQNWARFGDSQLWGFLRIPITSLLSNHEDSEVQVS